MDESMVLTDAETLSGRLLHPLLRLGLFCGLSYGGLLYILAPTLCGWLSLGTDWAELLKAGAMLIPVMTCDTLMDAVTRRLGGWSASLADAMAARGMQLALSAVFLPLWGLWGYGVSFSLCRLLHFFRSCRRFRQLTGLEFDPHAVGCSALAALLSLFGASRFTGIFRPAAVFLGLHLCFFYFFGLLPRKYPLLFCRRCPMIETETPIRIPKIKKEWNK